MSMANSFSLIKDYFVDQEDGIRQLITWFFKPRNREGSPPPNQ